jgi:hypothetical protein
MSKFKGGDMIVGLTNLPHYEVNSKEIKLLFLIIVKTYLFCWIHKNLYELLST